MNVTAWIKQQQGAWKRAVVHPFLDACADGTIAPESFNRWLVQDRLFVVECTRFVARLLQTCPYQHTDTLLGGLGSIKDELQWFEAKGAERNLSLDVTQLPACAEYCAFMRGLYDAPYAVQATAFWAIERAYNEAWQRPGPMKPPYDEFADRWGNSGFTSYVDLLATQAGEALAAANSEIVAQAHEVFLAVAELESHFWKMAYAN